MSQTKMKLGMELTLLVECLSELNNASTSAKADISLSMSVNKVNKREVHEVVGKPDR